MNFSFSVEFTNVLFKYSVRILLYIGIGIYNNEMYKNTKIKYAI